MRRRGTTRQGHRLNALIVVLWRAGLRIQVGHGKNDRRREVGMDAWAGWPSSHGWRQAVRGAAGPALPESCGVRISRSLIIRREPQAVFHWIEAPELAVRWQPDVAEYEITRPTVDVVGTEFREILRSATGSIEMRGRITAYEQNALMEFDVASTGIRVRTRYTLNTASEGTRLDVDAHIHFGGRLWWLLEPLVRRKMVRQFDADLARLRDLAEQTCR